MNPNLDYPRSALRLSLVASAVALTLLVGCGAKTEAPEATDKGAQAETPAAQKGGLLSLGKDELARSGLKVEVLQATALTDVVEVTATIQPNADRFARVGAPVEGRVVSVAAPIGAQVRAGQLLAVVESVALGEANATLSAARASARIAEADFKRAEALHADEIIAQKDYLRARAEYEKTAAELRAAEERVRVLGANPSEAGRGGARLSITAPFAGTVVARKATVGELATPSEPMFAVADLSTVWIEANLTEAMLARVRSGAKASVSVDAYPGEVFEGKVTYVAGMLDKASRTVPARIELANKDGRLKPEMFAKARIEAGDAPATERLAVPDDAIVLLQGQPTVFVAEADGFAPRAVELSEKHGGRSVVRSGVAAGERLVVAGAYALKARLLKSQIGSD
ncbi:efflux RND transporter periplasmic adaptor subunit [Niveibacterium sp.]|uniref:efflux RND transporter periplasmic adaptor subunit n=1 Tax=Niveibacterium sp. TaxID=2017444 RepID=UPI0035AEC2EB